MPSNQCSQFHIPSSDRMLRLPQVLERVGLSRSYLYLLIAENQFPSQIKLGARASGWLESEVVAWLESKVLESRQTDEIEPSQKALGSESYENGGK